MSELSKVIDKLTEELEQARADKAELLTMLRKVQRNRWDYPELNALLARFPDQLGEKPSAGMPEVSTDSPDEPEEQWICKACDYAILKTDWEFCPRCGFQRDRSAERTE